MYLKKSILLFLLFTSTLFAHRVAGVDMTLNKTSDDKLLINAFFKKSKKSLRGNEVRLISMFDNRVLKRGKLTSKGLILDIPEESYWVYVIVRDNDIVKNGLPPINGFKKIVEIEKVAFLYTSFGSLFLLFIALFIGYKRSKLS